MSNFTSDDSVKSLQTPYFVIPAKLVLDPIGERESSNINLFWTPACAGVTESWTLYGIITISNEYFKD